MFVFEDLKLSMILCSAVLFMISWERHTSFAENSQLKANHNDLV